MIFCPAILIFFVCAYAHICGCVFVCAHMYTCGCVFVCAHICVYVGACLCMCICVYVDAYFYVCMYGCMFVCVHIWRSEISLKSHSPCLLKYGLSMVWSSLMRPDPRDPPIVASPVLWLQAWVTTPSFSAWIWESISGPQACTSGSLTDLSL